MTFSLWIGAVIAVLGGAVAFAIASRYLWSRTPLPVEPADIIPDTIEPQKPGEEVPVNKFRASADVSADEESIEQEEVARKPQAFKL